MFEFYVYIYLNPLKPGKYNYGRFEFGFEPIYIGKGTKNRIDFHIYEALQIGNKTGKCAWATKKVHTIRKISNNGLEPIRYKLFDTITESSAFRLEKYFISLIGRSDLKLGPLCNLTDGGDGVSGTKWSDERRTYMSKLMTGRSATSGMEGKLHSEESKLKIGLSNKGKRRTNKHKENISKATALGMPNRIEIKEYDLLNNLLDTYISVRDYRRRCVNVMPGKLFKILRQDGTVEFKNHKFEI
jgi:hypothetical protein